MSFCLDDGTELLYGPASTDEPATAILHTADAVSDAPTRGQILTTEQTVVRPSGVGEIPGRSLNKRLIAVTSVLVVLVLAAFLGYRYFGSSTKQIGSIAVLPFANSTGDPSSEYISDGISEGIINSLSQLQGLRVVPRSTVIRFKDQSLDPQELGQKLNVEAVLTGRVVQRGDTLDVQTELVDISRKSQVWGQRYTRKISDVQSLQKEISRQIAEILRLRLTGDQELAGRTTTQGEAYQEYLKGRYALRGSDATDDHKALAHFNRALAIDANFAPAHAGIAAAYADLSTKTMSPSEAMPKAKDAVLKALALDPSLADAHQSLATIYWWGDWNYPDAESEFRRALELAPNEPAPYMQYSNFLARFGRFDEAESVARRAIELDPGSAATQHSLLRVYFYARRYDDILARIPEVIGMGPDDPEGHYFLGLGYLAKGRNDEAIAELRKASANADNLVALGYAYAVTGRRDEALKVLQQMQTPEAGQTYVSPNQIARVYAGLGDKEQAFVWLQKAFEGRDDGLTRMKVDPFMDPLRSDPRFADMMKKVGLE